MAEILTIHTSMERPTIKIDGESYDLQHPDELSLLEQHYLRQWGKEIEEAFRGDEMDPEAMSLAERRLRDVVTMLMPGLPPDVADRLSDVQRLAILQGFTGLAKGGLLASVPSGGA